MATSEFIGVPIHKDVTSYEEKIYGGLTKRQIGGIALACAIAGAVGLICVVGLGMRLEDAAYPIMILAAPPAVLLLIRPDDLPPEKFVRIALDQILYTQRLGYRSCSSPLCDSFHGRRRPQVPRTMAPDDERTDA